MGSIIIFSITNRFAIRSEVSNGVQRGCGGVQNVAVNGIRKEYIEVLDHRKFQIKRSQLLARKKGERDSEGTGKQKEKRMRKVKK